MFTYPKESPSSAYGESLMYTHTQYFHAFYVDKTVPMIGLRSLRDSVPIISGSPAGSAHGAELLVEAGRSIQERPLGTCRPSTEVTPRIEP